MSPVVDPYHYTSRPIYNGALPAGLLATLAQRAEDRKVRPLPPSPVSPSVRPLPQAPPTPTVVSPTTGRIRRLPSLPVPEVVVRESEERTAVDTEPEGERIIERALPVPRRQELKPEAPVVSAMEIEQRDRLKEPWTPEVATTAAHTGITTQADVGHGKPRGEPLDHFLNKSFGQQPVYPRWDGQRLEPLTLNKKKKSRSWCCGGSAEEGYH